MFRYFNMLGILQLYDCASPSNILSYEPSQESMGLLMNPPNGFLPSCDPIRVGQHSSGILNTQIMKHEMVVHAAI